MTARPRPTWPDAPVLETERLRLRLPAPEDFAGYARFYGDAAAARFYGGPLRPDQAHGVLCRDIGHWLLRGHGKFAVTAGGRLIGGCGIVHPEGWPSHELTWWLMPEARGRGYALEASRAVLAWAARVLEWAEVETHFLDANEPARRLTLALGGRFVRRAAFPDGQTRDVFAIPATAEVAA
ncbi:MAG: GNAT family N-acetyltransferase [Gemmobacter sp.]